MVAAMLRLFLIEAILFLIPFALYFAWRTFLDRREYETQGRFNERPWQLLIIAGGALVLAGLVVFALTSGRRGDMVYIPAHIVDGEVVPGFYISREEAGDLANVDPKERANPPPPPAALAPDPPRNHPGPDAPQ
jgi:hypothetical protein